MDYLTKYARKEPATDALLKKVPFKRINVQIYNDKECKKPYARFMWYQKKPKFRARTIVINCFRWALVWVNSEGA